MDVAGISAKDKWERVSTAKRAGVLAPLFSIYSRQSAGIGDLRDLRLLVDWAAKTGDSIIQLLPMNESGSLFCPYDACSSFALEPAYLYLEGFLVSRSIARKIERLKKLFPAGATYINYAVKNGKLGLLREIFQEDDCAASDSLRSFQEENAYWLRDFALYKAIKNSCCGRPWLEWEEGLKNCAPEALEAFSRAHQGEINFEVWLQWQLFRQFRETKTYARDRGILIKGDLPVLVSLDSADVWAQRKFFKLELAAGDPPDMYCAKGQRWGMPTYRWEDIAADGYRYLKEKLRYAGNFYDLLRIDHVAGLFRIWSIPCGEPLENQGLNGFFDPADEKLWDAQGRKILQVLLDSTEMLLCAEDLGVIPKCCTQALEDFRIPGNDVQRWAKDWKIKHDFLTPAEYRRFSVAMLSTHDTTNWPAWWENEAGTVDEALMMRRSIGRVDYHSVQDRLFDAQTSRHGRLRWLNSVDSTEKLAGILGKRKEEILDFVELYENSFQEKEKLWRQLKLKGPMRKVCDAEILRAALKVSLEANSVFCVNTLIDWLYLAGIFPGDPYPYRINTPGTVSGKNWSLTIPLSLEELSKHKVCAEIKKLITASGRR